MKQNVISSHFTTTFMFVFVLERSFGILPYVHGLFCLRFFPKQCWVRVTSPGEDLKSNELLVVYPQKLNGHRRQDTIVGFVVGLLIIFLY